MQIRAALARIENYEFGICQDCGQAIALGRLRVDPTAVLCISCAGAAEAR
jgi:DnaK suppressor protein